MGTTNIQPKTYRSFQDLVMLAVRVVVAVGFMLFSAYVLVKAGLALYELDLIGMVSAYFLFFCTVGLGPFIWPFSWPFGEDH